MSWFVPLGVCVPQIVNHCLRGKKKEVAKGNSAMKSVIIWTAHQILLGYHIQEDKMGWTCGTNRENKLDFCLTVHYQLGKVIRMNQLDATMIYWSIRSAKHVSGNLLPIIRSVRLRSLQHMVTCCCGGQGVGERQRDDGQKIARNMLSWSYRSINYCCI